MMIWTLEATPPWRITAADQHRDHHDDALFLDSVAVDDRGVVAAALASVYTDGTGSCECRISIGDNAFSAVGRLDLVRVFAHDKTSQVVAIWQSAPTAPKPETLIPARIADDQTMRQFLGQVSHDLRTPLSGVLGMTRLLLDSGLRADQIDYARAIDTSGEHLLGIIEDLLEFATLDTTTALRPVDFSPRALIEDVVDSLSRRAAEKDVEVCALVSARVPELVNADAGRMRQVLSYLVSDGIAWTGLGDVIVRVTLDADREAGPDAGRESGRDSGRDGGRDVTIRFEVTANDASPHEPIAMRPAEQAPGQPDARAFYRPHDWARDRLHGQSFELSPRAAVCRHLVTLMGGSIGSGPPGIDAVGVAPAGGAASGGRTVWFSARVTPRLVPPAPVPGYVSIAGRRVLCVDDHPVSQRVLLERLRGWNLQAEAIDEAHGALTLMKVASAAGTPFDLVILDLRLPGMDGLALARLIKADPALSSTRLVLLTGYPARGQGVLAQEAGIDAYLQKPIREAPLRSCLEMLLGGGLPQNVMPLGGELRPAYVRSGLRPRVLVAEDNPISQKVAVQMLEKLGCRVDVVGNGTEAVEAVLRTPYHLVLMDCQMHAMDGIEAARRIRSLPDHVSSPPIVALTGDAGDHERMQCLAAGMNDFVAKPLRLGTLREKLAQWIEASPHTHPHHLPG
jgi:two-component system, sensor histidine kinase and response regulator